jgi:NAD(P)-dependent dehydrogenase (short-subunit alcohol dehydrogenase family)
VELAGKRIVVTGAASGIGAATARRFEEAGAVVVGLDRDEPEGGERHTIDLADPASVTAVADAIGPPVDGLCNIAATGGPDAETVLRTNLLGPRLLTERLAPATRPGAAVVNVASFVGLRWRERATAHHELLATDGFEEGLRWLAAHPVDDADAYPYSKELVIAWTLQSAVAWRARAIRVNAVVPGPVLTPLYERVLDSPDAPRMRADVDAVGRPGTPGEIAGAIGFLCSDDARWITGALLPVDGGLAAMAAL